MNKMIEDVCNNETRQYFISESAFNALSYRDETPRMYVTFEEYVKLLFNGTPGTYVIRD